MYVYSLALLPAPDPPRLAPFWRHSRCATDPRPRFPRISSPELAYQRPAPVKIGCYIADGGAGASGGLQCAPTDIAAAKAFGPIKVVDHGIGAVARLFQRVAARGDVQDAPTVGNNAPVFSTVPA